MRASLRYVAAMAACSLPVAGASSQSAKDIRGPITVGRHRKRATSKADCRSTASRAAGSGPHLHTVPDGKPARRASVWQRSPRRVAAHRSYPHHHR